MTTVDEVAPMMVKLLASGLLEPLYTLSPENVAVSV
jgi:hypothetical protein